MDFIVDTHAFLWFLEGNNNLSKNAREMIEELDTKKFISIVSIWEIALKINLGKLTLQISLEELKGEIFNNNFDILPLDFDHIIKLRELEDIHKDPFDRMIIAQATCEKCSIISKDGNFKFYKEVNVFW